MFQSMQVKEEEMQQLLQNLFIEKKKVKDLRQKVQELGQERVSLRQKVEELEKAIIAAEENKSTPASILISDTKSQHESIEKIQSLELKYDLQINNLLEKHREDLKVLKQNLDAKDEQLADLEEALQLEKNRIQQAQAAYENERQDLLNSIALEQSQKNLLQQKLHYCRRISKQMDGITPLKNYNFDFLKNKKITKKRTPVLLQMIFYSCHLDPEKFAAPTQWLDQQFYLIQNYSIKNWQTEKELSESLEKTVINLHNRYLEIENYRRQLLDHVKDLSNYQNTSPLYSRLEQKEQELTYIYQSLNDVAFHTHHKDRLARLGFLNSITEEAILDETSRTLTQESSLFEKILFEVEQLKDQLKLSICDIQLNLSYQALLNDQLEEHRDTYDFLICQLDKQTSLRQEAEKFILDEVSLYKERFLNLCALIENIENESCTDYYANQELPQTQNEMHQLSNLDIIAEDRLALISNRQKQMQAQLRSLADSSHLVYGLLSKFNELFSRIYLHNEQSIQSIDEIQEDNQRLENKCTELAKIASNLKHRCKTLSEQNHILIAKESSSIDSLLQLNEANQKVKELSEELHIEKRSKKQMQECFSQEKRKSLMLTEELQQQTSLLEEVKKDLTHLEHAMSEQSMYSQDTQSQANSLSEELQKKITECQELSLRIESLHKENETLKNQENTLKEALQKFYFEMKRTKADATTQHQTLSDELARIQQEHATIKDRALKWQEDLQQAQSSLTHATQELEQLKVQYHVMQEQNSILKSQNEESHHSIKHLENELDKLLHNFAETKGQLKTTLNQQRILEQERSDLQQREQIAKSELVHTRRELEALKLSMGQKNFSQWQKKLEELQQLTLILEQENEELNAQKLILENKTQEQTLTLETLTQELATRNNQLLELDSLRQKHLSAQEVMNQSEKELKEKFDALQDQLTSQQQEITQLKGELNISHQLTQDLRVEKLEFHSQIEQLTTLLEKAKEDLHSLSTLNQEFLLDKASLQEQVVKLEEEKVSLLAEIEKLKATPIVNSLPEDKERLTQLNDRLISTQKSIDEHIQKITLLEKENQSYKETQEKQSQLLIDSQETLKQKQQQIEDLDSKLESAYEQIRSLRSEMSALSLQKKDQDLQSSDISREIKEIQELLDEKSRAYQALQNEYQELKNQWIDREISSVSSQERISVTQERLQELETKIQLQQQQLTQYQMNKAQLEENYQSAKRRSEQLDLKFNELLKTLESLQIENNHLKVQYSSAVADLQSAQDMKDQALEMLEHTQNALTQAKINQSQWTKEKNQWLSLGTFEECSAFAKRALHAESENIKAATENKSLKFQIEEISQQLSEQQKFFFVTSQALDSERNQHEQTRATYQKLQSDYHSLNLIKESLSDDNLLFKQQIASLQEQLQKEIAAFKEKENLLITAEVALEEKTQINDHLSSLLQTKDKELQQLQITLNSSNEDLTSTRDQLHSLQENYQNNLEKYRELQLEVSEIKHILAESSDEAQELQATLQKITAEREALESKNHSLESSVTLLQRKIDGLQKDYHTALSTNKALEDSLSLLQQEKDQSIIDKARLNDRISSFEYQIQDSERRLTQSHETIKTQQEQLDQARQQHILAEAQISQKQMQLQELQQLNSQEKLISNHQISQLKKEIEQLQKDVEEKVQLQQTILHLNQELSTSRANVEQLTTMKNRAVEQSQKIEQEFTQHKQMLAKKLKENALLFEAIEKHKVQARELHQQYNQALIEQESLKTQKEQLSNQIAIEQNQHMEKMAAAQQECIEWSSKYRCLMAEIEEYKLRIDSFEKMKSDYQKMRQAFSNLNQFIGVDGNDVARPAATTSSRSTVMMQDGMMDSSSIMASMPEKKEFSPAVTKPEFSQVDTSNEQDLFSSNPSVAKTKKSLFD